MFLSKEVLAGAAGLMSVLASAFAGVEWYAVDPMGETPYMPDKAPEGGRKGAPIAIVAAKGEYEPGSVVLVADQAVR